MTKISGIFDHDRLLGPLLRRLRHYADVSTQDIHQLNQLMSKPAGYRRHDVFLRRDEPTDKVFLVTDGVAAQEIVLEDGKACIVGFLIPGDMSDINSALSDSSDVTLKCLTAVSVVEFSSHRLREILDHNDNLKDAFTMLQLTSESMVRELIVNLAVKPAEQKIAHLLCELSVRLEKIVIDPVHALAIPLTQTELSEALGMTPIHVSRTFKKLRENNLVELKKSKIVITDWNELASFYEYDPGYMDQHEKADSADSSDSFA